MTRRALLLAVLLLAFAGNALAVDYYADTAGGNWTSNTTWRIGSPSGTFPIAGVYPGSSPGDHAFVTTGAPTVTVNSSIPNSVQLTQACTSCVVEVATGGTLQLDSSSSISGFATLRLSGGTITNLATLNIGQNSVFDWAGGLFDGAGTTNVQRTTVGPGRISVTSGTTSASGATINVTGEFIYQGGSVGFNDATNVTVNSTGLFDLQTINAITTSGAASRITNNGTFRKSGGPWGTNVDVPLDNNNIVEVTIGELVISNGTHSGDFDADPGTLIEFAATHTITGAPSTFSGGGSIKLTGTININTGATFDITDLTFQPGAINGPGTLDVHGTITFNDGTFGNNLTVNLLAGSHIDFLLTGGSFITGGAHIVNNTSIDVGTGASFLALENGGHITNAAGSTFTLLGDHSITSNGVSNPRIDNAGTLQKTGGGGIAVISAAVNNTGSVSVTSGSLELSGGGNSTGTFNVDGSLAFSVATHTLTGSTFSGTGLTKLLSGTLDINGVVTMNTPFSQGDGTVTGAGDLFLPGGWTWNGGTHSGTGRTFNNATATFSASNSAITLDDRQISNTGTINYAPTGANRFAINNGGLVANTGSFNVNGDFDILSNGVAAPLFDNRNFFTKTSGTGTATIFAPFDNSSVGSVTVSAGTLSLNGGGTNTATLALGANTLRFAASTYNLNPGTSITGTGTIEVDGATLVLGTPVTVANAILSAGAISGDNLSVTGTLTWTEGTMTGPGVTTVANLVSTELAAPRILDGRALTVNSTASVAPGLINHLTLDNTSSITNNGTFDLTAAGDIITNGAGSSDIINNGTLRKTGTAGAARIDVPVVNTTGSTLQALNGSLVLAAGGSLASGATIDAASAGNNVDVFGGTFTINGGAITGGGKFRITGSSATVAANANVSAANFEMTAGTLQVAGGFTFSAADFAWSGGTLTGTGTTRITTTGTFTLFSPLTVAAGHTLTNGGTLDYGATVIVNGTLANESGATLNITSNALIDGTGAVTNLGTLHKTGGVSSVIHPSISSTGGSIGADAGSLSFNGGGTITSALHAGSTVRFAVGSYTIGAPATITGSGTIEIAGTATVAFDTNVTIPTLLMTAGTLTGTGVVTINNGGNWNGGTFAGTGSTLIAATATFNINGPSAMTLSRALTNNGTIDYLGNYAVTVTNGITITNNNAIILRPDLLSFTCGICTTPRPRIWNAPGSTLTRNGSGAFFFTVAMPVDNDGTVNVATGRLILGVGGTHTGAFTVSATGNLRFGGDHTLSGTTNVSSLGVIEFDGGTTTFGGNFSTHTLRDGMAATAVFNTSSTATMQFIELQSAGTITGNANIEVSNTLTWISGTISGNGANIINVIGGGSFSTGAVSSFLEDRLLVNNGTFTYAPPAGSTLTLDNGIISNNGTFLVTTNSDINVGAGGGVFSNAGTFTRNTATGTMTIAPTFNNSSMVNLLTGTTHFAAQFTQSAGTTTLAAGTTLSSPFALNINGGFLTGTGTIAAGVNNGGTIRPGASPGTLTINGLYTQTNAGTLGMEIGGTTPGTQYDRLVLNQAPNLDGTIEVTLFGGFTPSEGQTFDLITWPNAPASTFSIEDFPTWTPSGSFESSYTPTAYRLIAQGPEGDLRVTQSVPTTTFNGNNVSFSVTVHNDGFDASGPVVLTNNFSGPATFVSAPGCTGTGPVTCNLGTIGAGNSVSIALTLNTNAPGTVSNHATVTSSTTDPDPSDNSNITSTTVEPSADLDLSINESVDPVQDGDNVVYTITLSNNGPDTASNVTVSLGLNGGSYVSINAPGFTCAGSGSNRTCSAPSFTTGSTTITVTAKAGATSPMSLFAGVLSSTHDPVVGNNSQTEFTAIECVDAAPVAMEPAPGATNVAPSGNLTWNRTSGTTYTVYLGPVGSGCSMTLGSTTGGSMAYSLSGNTTYEWRIEAARPGCPTTSTSCVTFTTGADCASLAPTLIAPITGTVNSPINFQWTSVSGATSYEVFVSSNGAAPVSIGTSTTNSFSAPVPFNGTTSWYVVATVEGCGAVQSTTATFNVCNVPSAPLARVVGQASSGQTYTVEWDAVPGATRYEVDEATNAAFTGATTTNVTGTELSFTKEANSASPFFYRVRAFTDCTTQASANSPTVRVVIVPLPPKTSKNPNLNVPEGSTDIVVHEVFIPGEPDQNLLFSATTDREWMTVTPSSGVLPPAGITLKVMANPADLPNGTFTATVIVTLTSATSSGVAAHATSTVGVPVSISIVTPVTPVSNKPQALQHALVIPTVGHLGGADATHWQSDVRLTNAGFQKVRYQLTFTPAAGSKDGVKRTNVTVDAGATMALDDIIRNWYGLGSLGDGANGSLEILPLDNPEVTALATVASSRTYNVTANGTLGQFVPAIPLRGFVGRAAQNALPQVLSLQQVAQSPQYRTNVGIVEATGKAASAVLTVFNAAGTKLLELPVQLAAGEQKQLNGLLAQNGITNLSDGRIEVKVTGGDGKVTAYASVVDNVTNDPLLVSGVNLDAARGSRYVLPGVADLETGNAKWRTDMRIFNAGTAPQPATLRFFPLGGGEPLNATVTLNAGEVRTLDDVVKTFFNASNVGGAVHVDTDAPATLVVTGRTYNRTETGTYGQFINAVTPEQATARSGRTLNILQVEDSTRYRTNIGVAEVTGKPATIELQVVLPDSKATPTLRVTLGANEFRQFSLIRSLGLGNVYNARVAVRVVDGDGRVTAYGSMIDEETQDPTYVPAQ